MQGSSNAYSSSSSSYKKKAKLPFNWLACLFLGFSSFGGVFLYDATGAVAVFLGYSAECTNNYYYNLAVEKEITPAKLGMLYSAWSLPNIPIGLIAGILNDKIGSTITNIIGNLLVVAGGCLYALAFHRGNVQHTFIMMLLGRFVAGMGSDTCLVVGRCIVGKWFAKGNKNAAMGFLNSLGTAGSFLSLFVLPAVTMRFGLATSAWLAEIICAVSFCSLIVYLLIEKYTFHLYAPETEVIEKTSAEEEAEDEDEEASHMLPDSSDVVVDSALTSIVVLKIRQILVALNQFSATFWLLCLVSITVMGTLWPFVALSPDFFHEKWDYSPERSGQLSSIIILVCLVATPLLGALIDKFGGRYVASSLASAMQGVAFLLLGWTFITPLPSVILLGLVLAVGFSVIYAAVAEQVPPKKVGVAMGVLRLCENIVYIISPLVFGVMAEQTGSFQTGLTVFAAFSMFGLMCNIMLLVIAVRRTERPSLDELI